MKKIIFATLVVLNFFTSCGTDNNGTDGGDQAATEQNLNVNSKKDTSFAQYISKNKIQEIIATGYAYKFGNPDGDGSILFKTIYNSQGFLIDSLIYLENKIVASIHNDYSSSNKLLKSSILDSIGNVQQVIERTYDANDNVLTFNLTKEGANVYSQKMSYEDNRITKIVEFDEFGNPRIATEYDYNESGKLIYNTEFNNFGDILKKTSLTYDDKGNNTVQTIYGASGQVLEKNFLKDYDKNGNAKIVEKYNANDSLIVTYQYEYNKDGVETKSIIYDGIGQVIRQSMSSYNADGNQTKYEIYEGGIGFIGEDNISYNEKGLEVELLVLDADKKQAKRKVSKYNHRDLVEDVINYDKLDEPNFKLHFEYKYFDAL